MGNRYYFFCRFLIIVFLPVLLLLVSDSPMVPEGVKTEASDKKVTAGFVERHLKIGIDSLKQLINNGVTVRHLKF